MPDLNELTKHLRGVSLAITIDDAPTVLSSPKPERMDRIRESLQRLGIRDCVAFVVGATAEGEEDRLRRWLEDGYLLGNHTYSHPACSSFDPGAVLDEVRRCDLLLEELGAFEGDRPRYFRFPYLDRGKAKHRAELQSSIEALGYRIVHGSLDWFDHRYEAPLARAAGTGDEDAALAVEDRHVVAALRATVFEARRSRGAFQRDVAQIAYCHFSRTAARALPQLVIALREAGVRFCSVGEALEDPIYTEFDRAPLRSGRVLPAMAGRGLRCRIKRLLALGSSGLGLFRQGKLGPLWPYFE